MKRTDPRKLLPLALLLFAVSLMAAACSHLNRVGVPLPSLDSLFSGESLRKLVLPDLDTDTVTVLVLGLDDAENLTDVMMVVRLDVEERRATLLQLPRDLYVGETAGVTGKLNAVFGWKGSTEQGAKAVKQVLKDQMDLQIDYYLLVDMATVRDAVDDLGGITVDVPGTIYYLPGKALYPGVQTLTGEEAEWLIRTRNIYADGDIGRMRAQLLFLSGAVDAVKAQRLPDLAALATRYYSRVETDMPLDVIMGALPILMGMEADTLTTLTVPLLEFAMNGEYAVFVASRYKLAVLLEEHFDVDTNRVVTPWGPPESEEAEPKIEDASDIWDDIFKAPNWKITPWFHTFYLC